ncbi:hypothetical protein [Kribbella sp. NPDC048915]|uniref:hypothetical protein n=1 Tax=Kribbella sp. NPDC048915 TaxID=3155148 RepID=UPI0033CE4870
MIYRYYTDKDSLEFILDGGDVAREVRFLAERAVRLRASDRFATTSPSRSISTEATAVRRPDRSTPRERS